MILVFQVALARLANDPANIQELLLGDDALLHLLGSAFPPSIWLTKMILGFWRETLLFVGLNIVFIFALRATAKTFYNHSLLGFNQASLATIGNIYYKKQGKAFQLIKRHILVITKQPMFLLNTVMVTFLPLLFFALNYFTGDLDFFALLESPELAPYLVFIFAGIISIPAMMANLSATAITREGSFFWETMVLPLSVRDNIKYRIATTLVLNFAGSIVLGIITLFFLPLTIKEILLAVCLCLVLTLFLATIDIIVNIHRPYLNWSHPTAAIKNNLNVIISLAFRAGLGFIFYRLYLLWPNLTSLQYSGLLLSLFLLFYLLAHFLVYGSYLDKFSKIIV